MTAETIAFISGKGGTGKTTVSISCAVLLAAAGYHVLLVDADLATHGLTFYFADFPEIADVPSLSSVIHPRPVRITDEPGQKIDLLPSSIESDLEAESTPSEWATARNLLLEAISSYNDTYDVIIVDCQAGTSPILQPVLNVADRVVVITEADPISIKAVERLVNTLRSRTKTRIFGMVSRVLQEESPYYEALTDYLHGIRFVGMLPFDREVRRAYFGKNLPVDLSHPTPFLLALVESISRISPTFNSIRSKLPGSSRIGEKDVERDLEQLQHLRTEAEQGLIEAVYSERRQRLAALSAAAMVLPIAVAIFVLYESKHLSFTAFVILLAVAATLFVASISAYYLNSARTKSLTSLRYRQERLLREIDERLDEYRVAGRDYRSSERIEP
jgi:cellulose biosynthesis protein BcsQ